VWFLLTFHEDRRSASLFSEAIKHKRCFVSLRQTHDEIIQMHSCPWLLSAAPSPPSSKHHLKTASTDQALAVTIRAITGTSTMRQISILNNNEYQPTLDLNVNEMVHVPLLFAQIISTGDFEKSQSLLSKLESQECTQYPRRKQRKRKFWVMGFLTLQARPTKSQ
jgi:hypothetical protein